LHGRVGTFLDRNRTCNGSEGVGIVGTHLRHLFRLLLRVVTERNHTHHIGAAAHGTTRHASSHNLGHGRHVWCHAESLLGTAWCPPEPGNNFIEDQQDVVIRAEVAHTLKELLDEGNGCPAAATWLHDHGGNITLDESLFQ